MVTKNYVTAAPTFVILLYRSYCEDGTRLSLIEENIFLSDYACGLVISDKRRYLEKISAIKVDS